MTNKVPIFQSCPLCGHNVWLIAVPHKNGSYDLCWSCGTIIYREDKKHESHGYFKSCQKCGNRCWGETAEGWQCRACYSVVASTKAYRSVDLAIKYNAISNTADGLQDLIDEMLKKLREDKCRDCKNVGKMEVCADCPQIKQTEYQAFISLTRFEEAPDDGHD